MVTTRATGELYDGFLLHSSPSKTKQSRIYPSHQLHLPKSWGVVTTSNGSMTLQGFSDYARWFVNQLPSDFGKGRQPAVLLFDGHGSRWTAEGISHLLQNNVWPFCLAAHTTAWAQPNDSGPNAALNATYGKEFTKWKQRKFAGRWVYTRSDFNMVIRDSYKSLRKVLEGEIIDCGENVITKAFRRCGLCPLNRNCEGWTKALRQFEDFAMTTQGDRNKSAKVGAIRTLRGRDEHSEKMIVVKTTGGGPSETAPKMIFSLLMSRIAEIGSERPQHVDDDNRKPRSIINTTNGMDCSVESNRKKILEATERRKRKVADKERNVAERKRKKIEKEKRKLRNREDAFLHARKKLTKSSSSLSSFNSSLFSKDELSALVDVMKSQEKKERHQSQTFGIFFGLL